MGFPLIQAGLLPLCFITSTLSLASLRDAVLSLLESVGIDLRQRRDLAGSSWSEADNDDPSSGTWDPFRSLPDEIRDSLAVVPFESAPHSFCQEEDAICAVCICEYQNQDPVCLLPSCSHIFHKICLHQWLDHNQTTCPTCRASLLTEELAEKRKRREEELVAELALWFSFYHSSSLMRTPWYRRHGFSHWIV